MVKKVGIAALAAVVLAFLAAGAAAALSTRNPVAAAGRLPVAFNGQDGWAHGTVRLSTVYVGGPDTFVRVRSTSTTPLDAAGPEQFTVEPGNGRVLTYAAVMAPRLVFSDDNTSFTATPVRAEWRLIAEQDDLPTASFYRLRFGSLLETYAAAGYVAERGALLKATFARQPMRGTWRANAAAAGLLKASCRPSPS